MKHDISQKETYDIEIGGDDFFFLNRPIFSTIFTNDYYQACLIKSVGTNDFSLFFFRIATFISCLNRKLVVWTKTEQYNAFNL